MRQFRMFRLLDDTADPPCSWTRSTTMTAIATSAARLANSYDPAEMVRTSRSTDVDLDGDRRLMLTHFTRAGRLLSQADAQATLQHVATLWGYEVVLEEVDSFEELRLAVHKAKPT